MDLLEQESVELQSPELTSPAAVLAEAQALYDAGRPFDTLTVGERALGPAAA